MAQIRSPLMLMILAAALTLTMSTGTAFAIACPPGKVPAFPGSRDYVLDPATIPQYVIPLVIPPVMNDTNPENGTQDDEYQIAVRQFQQQILPGGIWELFDPNDDFPNFPPTTVWSYGPAADPTPGVAPDPTSQFNYPAYTIETTSDVSVDVRWINDLKDPATGRFLPHLLPIDQTLHWANPPQLCIDGTRRTDCRGFIPERYRGPVPIVTHVHGSHVEGHSDGFPEAWFLPDAINIPAAYATKGRLFDDATGTNPGNLGYADFSYRNDQPATTLWYHDHTLGMTRSNVYAGPAGFWLIRGGAFDGAGVGQILPGPAPAAGEGVVTVNFPASLGGEREKYREIPIVIQDRSFNADGSLFYPGDRAFFEGVAPTQLRIPTIPNRRSDISPIWNPEAFFNVIVVNGVAWPRLEVAPALYRFRFLNGCNSRFLWLKFSNADVEVYQIGAEQGFLPVPVSMNNDFDQSGDGTAQLLMALAERADVIVDFRGLANGTTIDLLNIGPDEPFSGGIPGVDFTPSDSATTGKVMRIVVNAALADDGGPLGASPTDPVLANGDPNPNAATDPGTLTPNFEGNLGAAVGSRQVSLNEGGSGDLDPAQQVCVCADADEAFAVPIKQVACDANPAIRCPADFQSIVPFGPESAKLGTVNDPASSTPTGNPLMWTDMTGASTPVSVELENGSFVEVNITENPTAGDIEEWEMFNFTEDAHPIHIHMVRFQVVGRAALDETVVPGVGVEDWETGFKDTVISYPGQRTAVKALFDIPGLFVWHCHIVEHEDNEMMRPYVVSPATP